MSDGGQNPLGPVQIGGDKPTSLADDEKAIGGGGGTGTMIAAIVVFGLLAVGGVVLFMRSGGESEYSQLGRQINGMRSEHFDSFWSCALPREDIRDLHTADDVISNVNDRARSSPHAYAQLVRSQCMTHLDEHAAPLTALIVPADLQPSVEQLRTALNAETAAWTAYLAYLDQLPGGYDGEDPEATRLVTAVARGWYDYKVAHGAVNEVIRGHVTE